MTLLILPMISETEVSVEEDGMFLRGHVDVADSNCTSGANKNLEGSFRRISFFFFFFLFFFRESFYNEVL